MLVLTRNAGDSIQIGDDVEITVLEVKGKTARIGISAPRQLGVYRSELYVRVNSPLLIRGRTLAHTLDE